MSIACRRSPQPGAVLCKDLRTLLSELRVSRAYMRLFFARPKEDGSKTVSIARIGNFEVLLVDFSEAWLVDGTPLWLELYGHDIDAAIDSCYCPDFEAAVNSAKELIARAKALHQAAIARQKR